MGSTVSTIGASATGSATAIAASAALWVGSTTCSTSSPSSKPQVSSYSVV